MACVCVCGMCEYMCFSATVLVKCEVVCVMSVCVCVCVHADVVQRKDGAKGNLSWDFERFGSW